METMVAMVFRSVGEAGTHDKQGRVCGSDKPLLTKNLFKCLS